MALHSFCGILSLQVGVAIIAVIFWVIAVLTFVVNFFEFFHTDEFPVYALTISTFVVLLVLGGLIAFFSAYNESNALCMAGVALTALTTVVWVVISSLSFYNDQAILSYVCINSRCPETFWLAPLKYRLADKLAEERNTSQYHYEIHYDTDITTSGTTSEAETTTSETTTAETTAATADTGKPHKRHIEIEQVENTKTVPTETELDNSTGQEKDNVDSTTSNLSVTDYQYYTLIRKGQFQNNAFYSKLDDAAYYIGNPVDEIPTSKVQKNGYIFGLPLVGAVILFICNFLFFLFSILILWSYGQELAWTNTYLQDLPDYAHD